MITNRTKILNLTKRKVTTEKISQEVVEPNEETEKKTKDNYPDGVCPDCGEPILDNIISGEACKNCGHVFHMEK